MNALPMLHSRWMPSIDPSQPDALSELVTMRSQDVELGPVYTGDATVELFDAPGRRALRRSRPYEMIAGYWRQVGATFAGGTKLA